MQNSQTRSKRTLTLEENHLYRYYSALLHEGDIPHANDYGPYGDLTDIATEMAEARTRDGIAGLKQYIIALGRIKDQRYKRLVTILSSTTPQNVLYAGKLLSEVTAENVNWLWKPRLALGKITTIDGDPGLGKSLIGVDLGARITTGKNMPDGTPCEASGGVVVVMPEDGLGDTIQPRFARAGADLSQVVDLSTVLDNGNDEATRRPFTIPDDLDYLEAAIRRVDAKFVYIDPIMAVVGGSANTYKDNEVRSFLMPLKMLVEKCCVSCVVVRHMTKSRGENPLMAGGGSIAFVGLARTGLMVVRNPNDEEQTIFSHIKSNIGPLSKGIEYSVCNDEEQGDERPYVHWGKTTDLSGLELMDTPHKKRGGTGKPFSICLSRGNQPR